MKRRDFITLLGGAAAWPLAARAQQPVMPVIGYFSGRSPDTEAPLREPFLKALEELGFAAGRNVEIEYRFSQGQDTRLPALAVELVSRKVTMLVATDRPSAPTGLTPSTRAGKPQGTSIAFSGARSRPTCRCRPRRNTNW